MRPLAKVRQAIKLLSRGGGLMVSNIDVYADGVDFSIEGSKDEQVFITPAMRAGLKPEIKSIGVDSSSGHNRYVQLIFTDTIEDDEAASMAKELKALEEAPTEKPRAQLRAMLEALINDQHVDAAEVFSAVLAAKAAVQAGFIAVTRDAK